MIWIMQELPSIGINDKLIKTEIIIIKRIEMGIPPRSDYSDFTFATNMRFIAIQKYARLTCNGKFVRIFIYTAEECSYGFDEVGEMACSNL